jgi:hypothetical protein
MFAQGDLGALLGILGALQGGFVGGDAAGNGLVSRTTSSCPAATRMSPGEVEADHHAILRGGNRHLAFAMQSAAQRERGRQIAPFDRGGEIGRSSPPESV